MKKIKLAKMTNLLPSNVMFTSDGASVRNLVPEELDLVVGFGLSC